MNERVPWFAALRRDWRGAKKLYAVTQESGRTRSYSVAAALAYLLASATPNERTQCD